MNIINNQKLAIKVRPQLVTDGLTSDQYDLNDVGKHINAKEWNDLMESGDKRVIIDVRNHFESEIGHFVSALCHIWVLFTKTMILSFRMVLYFLKLKHLKKNYLQRQAAVSM